MDKNLQFAITSDILNEKIAELNILLSEDKNNESLKKELEILLNDQEKLFHGSEEEVKEIYKKYGSEN